MIGHPDAAVLVAHLFIFMHTSPLVLARPFCVTVLVNLVDNVSTVCHLICDLLIAICDVLCLRVLFLIDISVLL